jgi:hypothetical protein
LLKYATIAAAIPLIGVSLAAADQRETLNRSLADPSYRVRVQAVQALASMRVWQRAVPLLQRALYDEQEMVRATAAHSLGTFVEHDPARRALELAQRDPSELVREQAARALSRWPDAPPQPEWVSAILHVAPSTVDAARGLDSDLERALSDSLGRTPRVKVGAPGGLDIEATITVLVRSKDGKWLCEVAYSVHRQDGTGAAQTARAFGNVSEQDGMKARDAVLAAVRSIDWATTLRSKPL